jgi:hypothetical protein
MKAAPYDVRNDLGPHELQRIRAFMAARGETTTAALLGVSRQTLGRLLAGLPVHRGTVLVVREGLSRADISPEGRP